VDLGAGEGKLSMILARYAASVTAVDRSPRMLELIRMKAAESSCQTVVKTVEADIEHVPLSDHTADVVFLSQTLHHTGRPKAAIMEAARLLRPGGKLILLDLDRHEQEWLREEWADQWLGFDLSDLEEWVTQSGLAIVHAERQAGATPGIAVVSLIAEKHKNKEE
jgi:ArsR family transcriptional regulator